MSTDQPGRNQKVVMVLGIAAIILFSANLLSAVVKHFWPDFGFNKTEHVLVEAAPLADIHEFELTPFAELHKIEVAHAGDVHVIHRPNRKHRIVIRKSDRSAAPTRIEFDMDLNLEEDLSRLEAEIEAEMADLEREISYEIERGRWQSSLKAAQETLENLEIKIRHEVELEDATADSRN